MLADGLLDIQGDGQPLFEDPVLQFVAGVGAGLVIGVVAALLGVAGGELLIPTIVLLYGIDIRLAGSLALAVSLPTLVVGLARYRMAGAFARLGRDRRLFTAMAMGSIGGTAIGGGWLLGIVPARALTLLLGAVLAIAATKVFTARSTMEHLEAITRLRDKYNELTEREQDTPHRTLDLLPSRVNVAVIMLLAALSLVAWMSTIEQANSMRGMVMGLGQIGYRSQGNMSAAAFFACGSR
jgi:hypothetical protein